MTEEEIDNIGFDVNPKIGERSEFLKITVTMPANMLQAIRTYGLEKRSEGLKDCDVSSIVRQAVAFHLLRWSDDYKKKMVSYILNPNK